MIELGINGIVIREKGRILGDVGDIPVMGKTLEQWVGEAIRAPYKSIESSQVINICETLRDAVDRKKPYTVVLYCDTPLISADSVAAAVKKLRDDNVKALRLPRGYVFSTDYLFETDTLFLQSKPGEGEFDTVYDSVSLSRITDIIRRRILRFHSSRGVIFTDINNTYVDCDVVIESKTVIEPYNFIKGKTIIKSGAHILPGNYIEDSIIGPGAKIDSSRIYRSSIGPGTTVGPFAYLRPNSAVGGGCRIGDFVELKNCVIGDGTKVSHLTYIGDAELGRDCNVGCGVVFANYDGKNKYKTIVGDRVFIGSNSNLVAPVEIASRAFIAAGSTITRNVPGQALAVARARQTVIPDWAGNMYAPVPEKPVAAKPAFNLVSYSDGIIDATASDARNASGSGDGQGSGQNGDK